MFNDDMLEIFGKKEALRPELIPYLEDNHLRHPLVYSVYHSEFQNAYVNRVYDHKVKCLAEAYEKNDFTSYIFLHEKPYRVTAFMDIMHKMTDKEYWEILHDVWIGIENIWQYKKELRSLLKSRRPERQCFMSPEDQEVFNKLPKLVYVYRGYTPGKNKKGFSWTLDKTKAKWFANRFGKGLVTQMYIAKSDIFAYTNGRDEQEIIIL